MERRIGERFNYEEVTLEVVEVMSGCRDCHFVNMIHPAGCARGFIFDVRGECFDRDDMKSVIFKKIDSSFKFLR